IIELLANCPNHQMLTHLFEPITRMNLHVCEQLVLRMFNVFERAPKDVSLKSVEYQEWRNKMEDSFYCHSPTLHLLAMIFTNKSIVRKKSEHNFNHSEVLQTALEKVVLANVYTIDKRRLATANDFYTVLYSVILLKQFFYFYKNRNPKYEFDPYLDKNKHIHTQTNKKCPKLQSTRRVRMTKKPLPLSNARARANLLDFIQVWLSPTLNKLRAEIERRQAPEQSTEELDEIHRQLELCIAECMVGLINLGSIGDSVLERKLLDSLEKNLVHSNHLLRETAQHGMNALFKYNRHLLKHFVQYSCRLHLYYNEFISLGLTDSSHSHVRQTSQAFSTAEDDDEKKLSSAVTTPQPPAPRPVTPGIAKRDSGKMLKRISLFSPPIGIGGPSASVQRSESELSGNLKRRQGKDEDGGNYTFTSAVTEISLGYLRALVNNFVGDIQMYGTQDFNPIEALVLAMLHLCSPHQEARKLAAKLAEIMKKSTAAVYSFFFLFIIRTEVEIQKKKKKHTHTHTHILCCFCVYVYTNFTKL
ncbi:hypothetical protein RFI_15466, partial [Reticulomyxa filosa]